MRRWILITAIFMVVPNVTQAFNVPFATQAPGNNWRNVVFRDACEEASVIMAMSWINGETSINTSTLGNEIHAIAAWEKRTFGFHQDTSAADTARIFQEYYGLPVQLSYDIGTNEIIQALSSRKIAIVPINGQVLYGRKGPPRHVALVTGYDIGKNEFIIHDPMKQTGNIPVNAEVLGRALRDYPSGIHKPVREHRTAMIAVAWPWLSEPQ